MVAFIEVTITSLMKSLLIEVIVTFLINEQMVGAKLQHPIFGLEQSNIELQTLSDPSLVSASTYNSQILRKNLFINATHVTFHNRFIKSIIDQIKFWIRTTY